MNKKGFTLVELILVITLMAVVSVIIIPNIISSLGSSKMQKYESLYKIVEKNMKYYNDKYEVDLWSDESITSIDLCENSSNCINGINKLEEAGSELNLDDCAIDTMSITKNGTKYNYNLTMICGTEDKVMCKKDETKIKCE